MDTKSNFGIRIEDKIQEDFFHPASLQDIESAAANTIRKDIRFWIENNQEYSPNLTTRCRECGQVANYVSKRVGHVRTQFGLVTYRRAAYSCSQCHCTTYPMDERLNPVQSLARLRTKIAAGKSLPVAELAQAWGLGKLNSFPTHILVS
jgi:hypothetical protein